MHGPEREMRRFFEHALPAACIAGGSFERQLPPLRELQHDERSRCLASTREAYADGVIAELLAWAGAGGPVPRGAHGERIWPSFCTASVTHKGTFVWGAISPRERGHTVGIDLERANSNLTPAMDLIMPEGLWPNATPKSALLMAFSAKEAVYKAYHQIHPERLDFSDIRFLHVEEEGDVFRFRARAPRCVEAQVACIAITDWVVSAASAGSVTQMPHGSKIPHTRSSTFRL